MNVVEVTPRDMKIKAKRLRRSGLVPGVIRGAGFGEGLPVQLPVRAAGRLRRTKRAGSVVDVQIGEKRFPALIRELEYDSARDEIVQISFETLAEGKKVNGAAEVILINRDKARGSAELTLRSVPHAAEPAFLLDTVKLDLAGLAPDTVLTVGELPAFQSDRIELRVDPDTIILRVKERKRAFAAAESEEDEE